MISQRLHEEVAETILLANTPGFIIRKMSEIPEIDSWASDVTDEELRNQILAAIDAQDSVTAFIAAYVLGERGLPLGDQIMAKSKDSWLEIMHRYLLKRNRKTITINHENVESSFTPEKPEKTNLFVNDQREKNSATTVTRLDFQ